MFTHINKIEPVDLKVIEGPKGRFYVTPNGDKYPSITTLLSAAEKPWLAEWRNSLGEKKANKEMKRAADRGTAVHLMIERYLNNEDNPTEGQRNEHISEFNSVRLKLKKINNILLQEAALYSDTLKVAGRVDCIAEYDGILSVIDFKTSTNDKNESMIQDYFLQTTAYSIMLEEMYGIQANQVVIIMSTERGIVPLVFKKPIDDYIQPLCERVHQYYSKRK